jgi:hypothetical protein
MMYLFHTPLCMLAFKVGLGASEGAHGASARTASTEAMCVGKGGVVVRVFLYVGKY